MAKCSTAAHWDAERMDAWMAMFEENVKRWNVRLADAKTLDEADAFRVREMIFLLNDMVVTLKKARTIEGKNDRKPVGA